MICNPLRRNSVNEWSVCETWRKTLTKWERERASVYFSHLHSLEVHFTPTYRPEPCDIFYPAVKALVETSFLCKNLSFFTLSWIPLKPSWLESGVARGRVGVHLFSTWFPLCSKSLVCLSSDEHQKCWLQSGSGILRWMLSFSSFGEDFKIQTHRGHFYLLLMFFKISPADCFPTVTLFKQC